MELKDFVNAVLNGAKENVDIRGIAVNIDTSEENNYKDFFNSMLDIVIERKMKGDNLQMMELSNMTQLVNLKNPTVLLVDGSKLNFNGAQMLFSILNNNGSLPYGSIVVLSRSEYLEDQAFRNRVFHYDFPNNRLVSANVTLINTISQINTSASLSPDEKLALISALNLSEKHKTKIETNIPVN